MKKENKIKKSMAAKPSTESKQDSNSLEISSKTSPQERREQFRREYRLKLYPGRIGHLRTEKARLQKEIESIELQISTMEAELKDIK